MPEEGQGVKNPRMNEMFDQPVLEDQIQSPMIKAMQVMAMFVDTPVQWFRGQLTYDYRFILHDSDRRQCG